MLGSLGTGTHDKNLRGLKLLGLTNVLCVLSGNKTKRFPMGHGPIVRRHEKAIWCRFCAELVFGGGISPTRFWLLCRRKESLLSLSTFPSASIRSEPRLQLSPLQKQAASFPHKEACPTVMGSSAPHAELDRRQLLSCLDSSLDPQAMGFGAAMTAFFSELLYFSASRGELPSDRHDLRLNLRETLMDWTKTLFNRTFLSTNKGFWSAIEGAAKPRPETTVRY